MTIHFKLLALMTLILVCSISFLFATSPDTPTDLSWDYTTDVLSWESTSDPGSFKILIYKDGNHKTTVTDIRGDARSQNLHSKLWALGSSGSYTAQVEAVNTEGSSISALSPANVKGMETLSITAALEYGSDPVNFIFSRSSSTSFDLEAFTYSSATTTYNHSTNYAADSLQISFPDTGQYQLKAEYHDSSSSSVSTFTQAMVNGDVYVPLTAAASSDGMDASGNPNADTQNNVLTIVVNPGNTDFETTYTLRFRRRADNPPASITSISHISYAFTAVVNGSNTAAETTNGDNLSSLQELRWKVNSQGGTAYFTDDQMTPLSDGDITVTATLANNPDISATSDTYSLSGYSGWNPHLGKLEVRGKTGDLIGISPLFSSDPSASGAYSCSIVDEDDYSTLKLNLMAPYDSQIYINGARVSSNGESILRIGPTDPIDGPTAITYTIRVENAQGHKDYVLSIQREVKARLKYGLKTGDRSPHLASAVGDVFGMHNTTDKLTVQSWVRWNVDPASSANDSWATIASQTTSRDGSSGSFWLQHNNLNSAFEFAVRSTGGRRFVQSKTDMVTIQRGVWYQVTGVYDGSNVHIYVDGIEVSNSDGGLSGNVVLHSSVNAQFNVGKMPYGTRRFPGNVRALRIWVGKARTAAQIAADYAGTSTNDSDFSWPLNESAFGKVTQDIGSTVGLTMTDVEEADFVACCANNRAAGQTLLHRPERMDLSTADSESVVLVQASGYSGSDLRFRILGPIDTTNHEMRAWDHVNKSWIGSGVISGGVLMDEDLGNPGSGTNFWVPVRRGSMSTGGGRYVDDDTETGYDGTDADPGTRAKYNTIMPLPTVTAMSNPFSISGNLVGTTAYPLTEKYVILGYDALGKGRLITGSSSAIGTGVYVLKSDVRLHRIEVRTQDDVLITKLENAVGWYKDSVDIDATLPVELSNFTITSYGNGVRLQWVSQSESNLSGYYVFRAETEDFNVAEQVSGLIEATNSSQSQVYLFKDNDLLPLTTYYYWLMAVEYDGSSQVFGPINIILGDHQNIPEIPIKTGLDKLYPNPFNPDISIRYGLKEAADVQLSIYNQRGQKVLEMTLPAQNKGYHQYLWNASKYASGVYLLVFESGDTRQTRKITLSK